MNLPYISFPPLTLMVITIAILNLTGCANNRCSHKERSFSTAITILNQYADDEVYKVILGLEDVEALRIIAVSSCASAWPMEAGLDEHFDNRMDDIFQVAIKKLYLIDSVSSRGAIEYLKRTVEMDGAYCSLFKELEKMRSLRH